MSSILFSDLREFGIEAHLAPALLLTFRGMHQAILRVSVVDTQRLRTLVLEGTLIRPWTAEVEAAWEKAREQLQGRKLIVDLRNVTLINQDGETTLLKLMEDGAKFSCKDVLTKHVLKELSRRCGCKQ